MPRAAPGNCIVGELLYPVLNYRVFTLHNAISEAASCRYIPPTEKVSNVKVKVGIRLDVDRLPVVPASAGCGGIIKYSRAFEFLGDAVFGVGLRLVKLRALNIRFKGQGSPSIMWRFRCSCRAARAAYKSRDIFTI
jgi:hypothetical protein